MGRILCVVIPEKDPDFGVGVQGVQHSKYLYFFNFTILKKFCFKNSWIPAVISLFQHLRFGV